MKRFLITNTKFTGTAEIIYNAAGLLIIIDLANCIMDKVQTAYFKKLVPTIMDDLLHNNPFSADTLIIASELEVTFDMFWNAYQKKINRKRAEVLWVKLAKMEQVQAYSGVNGYLKFLQKTPWRSKADPDTFLRDKYYQNEYK